jgi:SsrA-binding protein
VSGAKTEKPGVKVVAQNRKARFDYHIEEVLEVGLVLLGPEVKSLRLGKASLGDAYAKVDGGELWLHKAHITPYSHAPADSLDPTRTRKLLANRREIRRLLGRVKERGLTLIPLSLYFKGSRVKLELGLAKGKKLHDKREDIKKREQEREMRKAMKRPLKD